MYTYYSIGNTEVHYGWMDRGMHACMTVGVRLFLCPSPKLLRTLNIPRDTLIVHLHNSPVVLCRAVSFRYRDCWFCDREYGQLRKWREVECKEQQTNEAINKPDETKRMSKYDGVLFSK
mmetsp:Transcript_23851/g.52165  ORF Transcript_23851/g.52165 Transcript_23851/m.52165 type:complete len:119 (-) Transcript_23851:157-513(-)